MKTQFLLYIILSFSVGGVCCYLYFRFKILMNYLPKTEVNALKNEFETLKNQSQNTQFQFESKVLENQQLHVKINAIETYNHELTALKASAETALKLKTEENSSLQKLQTQLENLQAINHTLNIEKGKLEGELQLQQQQLVDFKDQLTLKNTKWEESQVEIQQIKTENSTLNAQNHALTEKLHTHKTEILDLQQTAHLQFEKIANQLLEEKSNKFTAANTKNLSDLLKPLGENIELFKKKVEETYDKESKQRFTLEEKVKELIAQTNKVSAEANNLANALKTQSKKQGNWGEMILENILQQSGLVKDREYFLQQTVISDEGKTLRPDVLIKLPDHRVIIIDSKVSLTAYERFCSTEIPEEQKIHLAEHLCSIYQHIDNLHSKNYDHMEDALDFTMMFIPIEPAYIMAVQGDPNLWATAYKQRVMLISPTNLIACLKLMADLWKREYQSKNAMEIVKRGELLYEKFVGFVTTIEELGKHLQKTQFAYQNAVSQLNTGTGNLIGHAIKLKNLGLKSSKDIAEKLKPSALDMEDEQPNMNLLNPS